MVLKTPYIDMKAVIYARYSSHAQREESIEGQLRVCHDYARREGIDVIYEYTDSAMTGTNDQRPAFQKMIADSSKHQFEAVLVYAVDRFARERYDAAIYRKKLKDNGVRIVSVTQPIDDSPEGILLESLLEGLAEYYSKNLARGVKRGMRENALKCKAVGGIVPTGYKTDRSTMKYVLDPPKAAIVKEIFEMYANGHSIVDICKYCNAHGYRTNRDRPFTRNSMSTMLKNKRYTGVYTFDDIEIPGGMPAIIDEDTFSRVQERISMGHRSRPRKHDDIDFILTGKLFCGHCGNPMVGTSGTSKGGQTYYYYTCRVHGNKCAKHNEKKDALEDFIIDYIVNHFLTRENIEVIAERIMELINHDEFAMIMKSIEDQIRDKDRAIGNLMKAVEFGGDIPLFMNRIKDLQSEKALLEKELAEKKIANLSFLNKDILTAWMLDFAERNDGSKAYHHELINTFVNAIYIYDTDEPADDPNGKGRKKRKIVMAFNSSGPEGKVTLTGMFGQTGDQSTNPALPEHNDMYVLSKGRIIVVMIDY